MLSVAATSTTAYYESARMAFNEASASATQSMKMGRHTYVIFAENLSSAPYYSLGLYAGLEPGIGADLAAPTIPSADTGLAATPVYRYGGSSSVVHPITDRTDLAAHYAVQRASVTSAAADSTHQHFGARLSHRTSQSFGYHIGYALAQVDFEGNVLDTNFHNVDVGVDLQKSLSASRRTTLRISTGSTIVQSRVPAREQERSTEIRLLGNADLDHYLGRTWAARVSYRRDWQVLDGSPTLYFRDTGTVALSGNISTRTYSGVSASGLLGHRETQVAARRNYALSGSAWLRVAISKKLTVFGQYSHYQHRFAFQELGLRLPTQFERHGMRAGVVMVLSPR